MHAKVLRLRRFGVLQGGQLPPDDSWASGIFEMTDTGFNGPPTVRRLILRHTRSCPGMGLLMELFRPELVQVRPPYLRLRGIEAVSVAARHGAVARSSHARRARSFGPPATRSMPGANSSLASGD